MKKLVSVVFAAFMLLAPVSFTGCSTAPSARVVEVQTLKAVGQAADTAVATSAHLYASGTISAAQANAINDLYDLKFQRAYRDAVVAVNSDLSSIASPDLISLAAQLTTLVASYSK